MLTSWNLRFHVFQNSDCGRSDHRTALPSVTSSDDSYSLSHSSQTDTDFVSVDLFRTVTLAICQELLRNCQRLLSLVVFWLFFSCERKFFTQRSCCQMKTGRSQSERPVRHGLWIRLRLVILARPLRQVGRCLVKIIGWPDVRETEPSPALLPTGGLPERRRPGGGVGRMQPRRCCAVW